MKILIEITAFFLFGFFLSSGCVPRDKPEVTRTDILDVDTTSNSGKVRLIFYNMYLPTESSRIFEKLGANYTPDILNPSDNFSHYTDDAKIALNLGVYGVDLSYCRIFNQNAAIAQYFSTVQLLYEKLGIPSSYFDDLLMGLEKYYNNKDSLAKFASDVFEHSDNYLRENKNDAFATMIITGGWVESLYLAGKIAEANPESIEIAERIAGQKYSLNSLISLLSNYQENIVITEYILMLKGLKKSFDKIDIYYNNDSFQLDTINKLISVSDYEIKFSPEVLKEITQSVSEIRSEIVD
jgi:hypothetical protein